MLSLSFFNISNCAVACQTSPFFLTLLEGPQYSAVIPCHPRSSLSSPAAPDKRMDQQLAFAVPLFCGGHNDWSAALYEAENSFQVGDENAVSSRKHRLTANIVMIFPLCFQLSPSLSLVVEPLACEVKQMRSSSFLTRTELTNAVRSWVRSDAGSTHTYEQRHNVLAVWMRFKGFSAGSNYTVQFSLKEKLNR